MGGFLDAAKRLAVIFAVGPLLFLPSPIVQGSSPPGSASSKDVSQIESVDGMRLWLDEVYAECLSAKREGRFTLELQERVVTKAGQAISKILELEKGADLSGTHGIDAFKAAFARNEDILQFVMRSSEEQIDTLREENLDKAEDPQAFLDSPTWQVPNRFLSLSRYWMSWSHYYRSFLHPQDLPERRDLLEQAISGFSLALLDFEEEKIVAKSLLGRALCFKEIGDYQKAAEDLKAIAEHVSHNDPLYMWSLYEQAWICHRNADYEAALGHLDRLGTELDEKTLSETLGDAHKRLRDRVVLEPRAKALLEQLDKEKNQNGEAAKRLCHDALPLLRRLSAVDQENADRLYQLVAGHPSFFQEFSYQDLGPVGALAVADDDFKNGKYDRAVERYRFLRTCSEVSIRKRLDDILFRSGYACCQIGLWKDALACFDELYAEFPNSSFVGKAVCLEYVAAAGQSKQSPGESSHARYVDASRRYLKECPNPRDKDGAHFLLGKHYEEKGRAKEARTEFSAIEQGSPHHWPARYQVLKADVEELERRGEGGERGSATTSRLYQSLQSEFAAFQGLAQDPKPGPGVAEVTPHMTILQARLSTFDPGGYCQKAIQTLQGFEKRFPRNEPLWLAAMNLRLTCYREHRMFDAAKEQLVYLAREYPVDRDLWDFLRGWGDAYEQEANKRTGKEKGSEAEAWRDLALTTYTEMSALASGNGPYRQYLDAVQFRMAEILSAQGETERAGRIYEEILNRIPDSAEALYNLGRIYEELGNWDAALEMWRRYSKGLVEGSNPWLESRYRIARAHSQKGRQHEACEVITMIRVLYPDIGDVQVREKILGLENEVCAKKDRTPRR